MAKHEYGYIWNNLLSNANSATKKRNKILGKMCCKASLQSGHSSSHYWISIWMLPSCAAIQPILPLLSCSSTFDLLILSATSPCSLPLMTVYCQFTHTAMITNDSPLNYNPTTPHLCAHTHIYIYAQSPKFRMDGPNISLLETTGWGDITWNRQAPKLFRPYRHLMTTEES